MANLAVLVAGAAFLSGMIGTFIYHLRELWESLAYAQTLFDFPARRFDNDGAAASSAPADAAPRRLAAIRLNAVGYTYPNGQKPALSDASCVFSPGLTAIVGTNGAGKSTLVKLVAGLVPPDQGTLQAIGRNGDGLPLVACVKSVLFQDPGHFPFSIRHNVTMRFERSPDEDEQIGEALRQAGLWDVVQSLPHGLETVEVVLPRLGLDMT